MIEPHVFRARWAGSEVCTCGLGLQEGEHVPAAHVPRDNDRVCSQCRRRFRATGDNHYHAERRHDDRTGEGPYEFCDIGCLAGWATYRLLNSTAADRATPVHPPSAYKLPPPHRGFHY